MHDYIKSALYDAQKTIKSLEGLASLVFIQNVSELIASSLYRGKKIIICGNGGSMCDAMHFAEEFSGRFRKDRKALPALSLSDPSFLTCVGNDYGFEKIFARGVEAFGEEGDLFFGLSTSGQSKNILLAFEAAKKEKLHTIAFLGKDGGALKGLADHEIIIEGSTSDRIQEAHMTVLHILVEMTERILFKENYKTKEELCLIKTSS